MNLCSASHSNRGGSVLRTLKQAGIQCGEPEGGFRRVMNGSLRELTNTDACSIASCGATKPHSCGLNRRGTPQSPISNRGAGRLHGTRYRYSLSTPSSCLCESFYRKGLATLYEPARALAHYTASSSKFTHFSYYRNNATC